MDPRKIVKMKNEKKKFELDDDETRRKNYRNLVPVLHTSNYRRKTVQTNISERMVKTGTNSWPKGSTSHTSAWP